MACSKGGLAFTTSSPSGEFRVPDRGGRRAFLILLAVVGGLEAVLFSWLCAHGQEALLGFVQTPDSSGYVSAALETLRSGSVAASKRTPGYPLFLYAAFALGGQQHGIHLAIGLQLLLNLLLVWLGWRLLERTASEAPVGIRVGVTALLGLAGAGMAFLILTDFLAAMFFTIFVYGLLFWRRTAGLALAGCALALATLLRPTFTFLPLLLPVAGWLASRFTTRVPGLHLAVYAAFSIAATTVSIGYQYYSFRYLGPSSVVTQNIEATLYIATAAQHMTLIEYRERFTAEISRHAGAPFVSLSETAQEKYARQVFLRELAARPALIFGHLAKTSLKYVLAPVESLLARWANPRIGHEAYTRILRPVVSLVLLPIWILALTPLPLLSDRRAYFHLLALMLLAYVVGVSSIAPIQGERIRFPVLPLLLPPVAWRIETLLRWRPWGRGAWLFRLA